MPFVECWVCKDTGRVLDPVTKTGTIPCYSCRQRAVREADRDAIGAAAADGRYDQESAARQAFEDEQAGGAW